MTNSIQDTLPSGNVNVAFLRSESGGSLNRMQVNQMRQGNGESSNGKPIGDGIVGVDLDGAEDLVDGFTRDFSYQGAFSLARPSGSELIYPCFFSSRRKESPACGLRFRPVS
jgi:hypothetical protein